MSTIRFHLPGSRTLINGSLAIQNDGYLDANLPRSVMLRDAGQRVRGAPSCHQSVVSPLAVCSSMRRAMSSRWVLLPLAQQNFHSCPAARW
jgi:hypothetical protein